MSLFRNIGASSRAVVFWVSLAFLCPVILEAASASTPASTAKENVEGQGTIVLAVTFDRSGKVADCRLVRSNAPVDLEASTVEYVQSHWVFPFFAGTRVTLPIVFNGIAGSTHWNGDFPLPPNPFPYDAKKYAMKLRLTYNDQGWISHVQALQTSGVQLADDQTGAWIRAHWHHTAYANQVVDVPLEFVRPPAPPPPVVPRVHVKPVPSKPAPPAESAAIPAVQAH